jgi:hypothetical protein
MQSVKFIRTMTSSCRSFKRQHVDKNEIELILDRNSEMTEENNDKTNEEEDDVKGQAPILPHQEVHKQNLVNGPVSWGCPQPYR